MADKEKITLQEALDKFPEVCKALLGDVDFEMLGKVLAESDWHPTSIEMTRDRLIVAVVKWLEGKPVATSPFHTAKSTQYWADDMLLYLLTEVSELLRWAERPGMMSCFTTAPKTQE